MQFGTYVKWLNMKINTSVFNYKTLIKIADVQNQTHHISYSVSHF